MDDDKIITLYWNRSEQAIRESSVKYGAFCHAIAQNILVSGSDAEECVNDTWLRAWNAMPPQKPSYLRAFFGRITRNLSFDRWKALHTQKRGGGQIELVLDELAECVSGRSDPAGQVEARELAETVDRFLRSLPKPKRDLFLLRYWYADSIASIAQQTGKSENLVSVTLHRIRADLKAYLTERGYEI